MTTLQLVRPDVSQLSIAQIAEEYPSNGWEEVFKAATPELGLVSRLLSQLEPYFPPKEKVFRSMDLCPLYKVKVVIIGQDPYHSVDQGRPQANGMAFSTDRGHPVQPSLKNIYKELEKEYGEQTIYEMSNKYMENRNYLQEHYKPEYYGAEPDATAIYLNGQMIANDSKTQLTPNQYDKVVNEQIRKQTGMTHAQLTIFRSLSDQEVVSYVRKNVPVFQAPNHGDLTKWAEQGVMLLNTCLTVAPHQAGSHKQIWNGVIRRILDAITEVNPECIYLLWGAPAKKVGDKLGQRAIKLYSSHPSPLSAWRGTKDVPAFLGCGHFRQVNEYLKQQGKEPIDWFLD